MGRGMHEIGMGRNLTVFFLAKKGMKLDNPLQGSLATGWNGTKLNPHFKEKLQTGAA